MSKMILKLYVTGKTAKSERAISNLKALIQNEMEDSYELIVIDVLERPQLAEDEKIIATPMLIKELPPPIKRIIGDLSNKEKMLLGLDLVLCDHDRSSGGD